ncbi:uncharacterized protein LOC135494948 [Lineus longissimus]|uniref:uncharacterized protein LOC135494948 n=1 Tax=Lineus longissimus TaxID=88925 RepID=UPI002B4E308B
MDLEIDDSMAGMPVPAVPAAPAVPARSYPRNDQPRRFQRKDSVVSFSASTNSQTPILKQRSYSQSSYGGRSMDSGNSTASTEDKVEITKLKLYIKIGLGILIPVVVILFIAVIYLFMTVHTSKNTHYPDRGVPSFGKQTGRDEKEHICVECKKLQFALASENIILNKLLHKMNGGKQMCCARTAEQTDLFMKRYFDVKIKEERASGGLCMGTSTGFSGRDFRNSHSASFPKDGVRCTNSKNPSVHLIGTNELKDDDLSADPDIVTKWADNSDIAFRNSVSFNRKTGVLTVPKNGFYYVYSQIHFIQIFPRVSKYPNSEHRSAYDKTPSVNSLTHTIKRTHHNYYPEEMLKRRQSQCWVTNKLYSEYTSYMGGIMSLRQGDEIYVEVSNKSMISSQSKMNFFGLFYVAPNDGMFGKV